jgi:hypothetical protein
MADTAVAITAGVGTNIDTRTESTNSNHRQVIVVGDPTANAAVATVTDAAPTAADYALVVGIHPDSVNANGQATMANSAPVVIASNQTAVPVSGTVAVTNTPLTNFGAGEYETVAASQTDQILGATGAVGDYLSGILITPTTTGAGSVSIKDGNGSAIPIFNTGTLSNLVPFFVPIGAITVNATTPGWKVTTGANVTVLGIGNFT